MPWSEMARVAEYLVSEIPHLRKAEKLDRDGMAQVLSDMAGDIIMEADKRARESIRNMPDAPNDDRGICTDCNGSGESGPDQICGTCDGDGAEIPEPPEAG